MKTKIRGGRERTEVIRVDGESYSFSISGRLYALNENVRMELRDGGRTQTRSGEIETSCARKALFLGYGMCSDCAEIYRENRALKILAERHDYRINILGVVRRK